MRFAFIEAHRQTFDLEVMCRVLEVSRSGFYAWRGRPQPQRSRDDQRLTEQIAVVHATSRAVYGAPRVHAELRAQGVQVSRPRVSRLMRQAGLRGRCKRRYQHTTNSRHQHPVAENVLARDFSAQGPDQKWVADITYLPTLEGWLYLAVVLDVFSRRVVGWSMGTTLEARLALDALEMARVARKPTGSLVHHSDRGVQYASNAYRWALEGIGATVSMSRRGNCWDNALCESFFASLKTELDLEYPHRTKRETRAMVFDYLEVFYNRQRRHSSLDYLSPAAFEEHWAQPN